MKKYPLPQLLLQLRLRRGGCREGWAFACREACRQSPVWPALLVMTQERKSGSMTCCVELVGLVCACYLQLAQPHMLQELQELAIAGLRRAAEQ